MSKKLILCDLDTEENGYNYKCKKLESDDYDELEDCCSGCSHRCFQYVEIKEGGEK